MKQLYYSEPSANIPVYDECDTLWSVEGLLDIRCFGRRKSRCPKYYSHGKIRLYGRRCNGGLCDYGSQSQLV